MTTTRTHLSDSDWRFVMNTHNVRAPRTGLVTLPVGLLAVGMFLGGCSTGHDDDSGVQHPTQSGASVTAPATEYPRPTATTSRVPTVRPETPILPTELPAEFANLDRTDPDSVAAAFARLWFTQDTSVDLSPYHARLRVAPLLTPELAGQIAANPPISGPGADWLQLTQHNARLTVAPGDVRTIPDESMEGTAPTDTSTRVARVLEVRQTITTSTDDPPPARTLRVAVIVHLESDGWRVARVEQR
jgi:hypothetical protein